MSGYKDTRSVRPGRSSNYVDENAFRGRSSTYHGRPSAGQPRHSDHNLDELRYRETEKSSTWGLRAELPQEVGPSSDRRARHGSSRDEPDYDRAIDQQHEDTGPQSDSVWHDRVKNRPQVVHRTSKPVPEQSSREPLGTPGERVPEPKPVERPVFRSRLSPLAKLFAAIRVDDYAGCRGFISQNRDILDADENDFVNDAEFALASSHPERVPYARRCIQQSLILRHCKQRDKRGREIFFARLEEEEKKTAVDFVKESDNLLRRCQEKAQRLLDASSEPRSTLTTAEAGAQKGGPSSRHAPPVEDVSRELSALNLDSSTRQRYAQTEGHADPGPRPSVASSNQQEKYRRGSLASAGSYPRPAVEINQSGHLVPKAGTHIRGSSSNGQQQGLHETYYRRDRAEQFFIIGRVFSTLWHEPAGDSQNDRLSESTTRLGLYGEPIVSHIRRLVVVSRGHGKCWAIPIYTYRGLGVAKPGFNEYDIAGHAVVYATGRAPYTAPKEPTMSKNPLKVNMVPGEKLDPMSRINFTIVHTVEYNVKVCNIGKVHQDSLGDLAAYWSAQNQIGAQ